MSQDVATPRKDEPGSAAKSPPANFAMRLWCKTYRPLMTFLSPLIGPIKVYGRENIPDEGALIFVANHLSYWDPPVLGWKAKRLIWAMGKKELFQIPILGPFFRAVGVIEVDQKGQGARHAIKAALEQLNMNRAILIFPEGTRTRGPMGKGHSGVAMIARRSCAPILPVLITGTHRSLSPDHPGVHRGPVTVTFGKPYALPPREGGLDLDADTDYIMQSIEALRAITPGAPPPIREEDLPPPKE